MILPRAESVTGPGFNLWIVSEPAHWEYFDIRFSPTLSFVEHSIRYTPGGSNERLPGQLNRYWLNFPFHVRYKSATYHDFRLFLS